MLTKDISLADGAVPASTVPRQNNIASLSEADAIVLATDGTLTGCTIDSCNFH
jgi:hypothetical protein